MRVETQVLYLRSKDISSSQSSKSKLLLKLSKVSSTTRKLIKHLQINERMLVNGHLLQVRKNCFLINHLFKHLLYLLIKILFVFEASYVQYISGNDNSLGSNKLASLLSHENNHEKLRLHVR